MTQNVTVDTPLKSGINQFMAQAIAIDCPSGSIILTF